jgi:hypothetical protein
MPVVVRANQYDFFFCKVERSTIIIVPSLSDSYIETVHDGRIVPAMLLLLLELLLLSCLERLASWNKKKASASKRLQLP